MNAVVVDEAPLKVASRLARTLTSRSEDSA
jgi:hypothetical protein